MATSPKEAQARAEASFKKKEEQQREGAKAMAEYLAAGNAERDKTARLKTLREARDAAEAAAKTKKLAAKSSGLSPGSKKPAVVKRGRPALDKERPASNR